VPCPLGLCGLPSLGMDRDSGSMSSPLVQQLPALVGVVVGGAATFVATSLGDRARWSRERRDRWDAARMKAYVEFGDAVKHVFNLSTRIAAGRGLPYSADPLPPGAETLAALGEAEAARVSYAK